MSALYTLRSRVSVPVLLIVAAALYSAAAVACGASFVGPATERADSYTLHCGSDTCDPNYYACSNRSPYHCEFVGTTWPSGSARDAGADR